MPTDKTVLVAWKDYSAAKELSAQVSRQVEEERAQAGGEGETFQDMPRKKRILVQTVSPCWRSCWWSCWWCLARTRRPIG